jgi:excinuclease UvrABC nuclease subunit
MLIKSLRIGLIKRINIHLRSRDLISNLGLKRKNITIEGFDISHHSGKNAVASAVRFSSHGPEKNNYRLFNIPNEFSGNDIGSMRHVLERRINKAEISTHCQMLF